jgi:UDP-2,3-diacylglucosamine hydrolase
MNDRPSIIVSDLHLGAVPRAHEEAFIEFLAQVPERTGDLVINGDLFDFWFEYGSVVLRGHFRVQRALADVVDAGVRVRLVGGNHDAWGGPYLRDEIGLELVAGPVITRVGGRLTYLAHGDGLGKGDVGHKIFRRISRHPLSIAAFRLVHPGLALRIAGGASATERNYERGDEDAYLRASRLSEFAAGILREDESLALVALGHCHQPELVEVAPGRFYLNTGDWLRHFSYGVVSPEEVRLETWEADGVS